MKEINNQTAHFVKTQDKETAENLIKSGYEPIDYTDGIWTFVNNPNYPLTFDKNKITYSNMLCI